MIVKSGVFDIAGNHGGPDINIRSIDFYDGVTKLDVGGTVGFTAYSTSSYSGIYAPYYAFDVSLSKTGAGNLSNSWNSGSGQTTNQRLIIVFDSPQNVTKIAVNNGHHNGTNTTAGADAVDINISTDAITSTVYNESIANSTLVYNSTFDEHVASDVEDEQILVLIALFGLIDVALDLSLTAYTPSDLTDMSLDLNMAASSFENATFDLFTAKELNKNASLDLSFASGEIIGNLQFDLEITDGNKITDAAMDVMLVATMPTFTAVYAMHLASGIKEI